LPERVILKEGGEEEEGGEEGEEGGAGADFGLPHPSRIHCVTASEAAAGRFSVDDVVIPLAGSATVFSSNELWGLPALGALLKRDGLLGPGVGGSGLEDSVRAVFHPRDARFQFSGGYRHLLGRAEGVDWRLLGYGGGEGENLAVTDFEKVLAGRRQGGGGGGAAPHQPSEPQPLPAQHEAAASASAHAGCTALELTFSLKKSHYATVALREVLCH